MSWQIVQTLYPQEKTVDFVSGTKLVLKKGLSGATGNIYTGLHDFQEMGFLLHFLRREDLFFDVGSNLGTYSVLASGCIGCRSVCFEPVPDAFYWLKKNIGINSLERLVIARNEGVGSESGTLRFTDEFDTMNHVSTETGTNENNTTEVPVSDLDSLSHEMGSPILIKIDVEGYEPKVLNGLSGLLDSSNLKAVIIEITNSCVRYGYKQEYSHDFLRSYGFKSIKYDPFERDFHYNNETQSDNLIYIKDVSFVRNRLIQGGSFKTFGEII